MRVPVLFYVRGEPQPQPRPRARAQRMGQKWVAQIYNPKDADGWKKLVSLAANPLACRPYLGPVELRIIFNLPRPKSHYRTGSFANQLRTDAPTWHTGKPDFDNLAKAICDALTQCGVWKDDGQVCKTSIVKVYANDTTPGDTMGAQIEISELAP